MARFLVGDHVVDCRAEGWLDVGVAWRSCVSQPGEIPMFLDADDLGLTDAEIARIHAVDADVIVRIKDAARVPKNATVAWGDAWVDAPKRGPFEVVRDCMLGLAPVVDVAALSPGLVHRWLVGSATPANATRVARVDSLIERVPSNLATTLAALVGSGSRVMATPRWRWPKKETPCSSENVSDRPRSKKSSAKRTPKRSAAASSPAGGKISVLRNTCS